MSVQGTMSKYVQGRMLVQVSTESSLKSEYNIGPSIRVSVSHSFSQISYLFEPLESTECLHSQDTMSIRGTILVQVS